MALNTGGSATSVRRGEPVVPPRPLIVCDRLECPAPALDRVDAFGQDFYFCHHHWLELEPALAGGPDAEPSTGPLTAGSWLERPCDAMTVPAA